MAGFWKADLQKAMDDESLKLVGVTHQHCFLMNESHNGKSNTHQTMREVVGCTCAMHGNDMAANTVIQAAAASASAHSNRIIEGLHLFQYKQVQKKIRDDKECLLPHAANKDRCKIQRERQVLMKAAFSQALMHAQMFRSLLQVSSGAKKNN